MLIDFPASSEKEGFIHQACALAQRLACLFSESKITDLSSCSLCTLLFFFSSAVETSALVMVVSTAMLGSRETVCARSLFLVGG